MNFYTTLNLGGFVFDADGTVDKKRADAWNAFFSSFPQLCRQRRLPEAIEALREYNDEVSALVGLCNKARETT